MIDRRALLCVSICGLTALCMGASLLIWGPVKVVAALLGAGAGLVVTVGLAALAEGR